MRRNRALGGCILAVLISIMLPCVVLADSDVYQNTETGYVVRIEDYANLLSAEEEAELAEDMKPITETLEGGGIPEPMKMISGILLSLWIGVIINFHYVQKTRKQEEDENLPGQIVHGAGAGAGTIMITSTEVYKRVRSGGGSSGGGGGSSGGGSSGGGGGHSF